MLLLGITLSVASLFPSWATDLSRSITEDTSEQNKKLLDSTSLDLELTSANYRAPSDSVEFVARLNSESEINSSFNAVAYCDGEFGGAESFEGINGLETFSFNLGCEPNRIELSLKNYPSAMASSNFNVLGYSTWDVGVQSLAVDSQNIVLEPLSLNRNQESDSSSTFDGAKINTTEDNGVIRLAN